LKIENSLKDLLEDIMEREAYGKHPVSPPLTGRPPSPPSNSGSI